MYNKDTRIRGGSNFADAMFRLNASPQEYAKIIFERVMNKNDLNNRGIKYFASTDFFILVFNQVPVFVEDFSFVEMKRSETVHAFEEWLTACILNMKVVDKLL